MDKYSVSDAINLFITTDKMHRQLFESRISNIGIHRSQHRVLMYLAQNDDVQISQKDIAQHFNISPAAVAVTLKKLESAGYIAKSAHKDDNRINNVSITNKAREVVKMTEDIVKELELQIFDRFSEEDINCFCNYLKKMQVSINTQL